MEASKKGRRRVKDGLEEAALAACEDVKLSRDTSGRRIHAHTLLMRLRNSRNRSNVSKAFSQVQPLSSMKEPQLFNNELLVHV